MCVCFLWLLLFACLFWFIPLSFIFVLQVLSFPFSLFFHFLYLGSQDVVLSFKATNWFRTNLAKRIAKHLTHSSHTLDSRTSHSCVQRKKSKRPCHADKVACAILQTISVFPYILKQDNCINQYCIFLQKPDTIYGHSKCSNAQDKQHLYHTYFSTCHCQQNLAENHFTCWQCCWAEPKNTQARGKSTLWCISFIYSEHHTVCQCSRDTLVQPRRYLQLRLASSLACCLSPVMYIGGESLGSGQADFGFCFHVQVYWAPLLLSPWVRWWTLIFSWDWWSCWFCISTRRRRNLWVYLLRKCVYMCESIENIVFGWHCSNRVFFVVVFNRSSCSAATFVECFMFS